MEPLIDLAELVCAAEFSGDDPEDEALIAEMIGRAHAYLSAFSWCDEVIESYVGDIAVGGVILVMLARIVPSDERADEWLWVIVGDLPPAYLVTEETPDPASALDAYIGEMERWVEAVRTGSDVKDLIPVETSGGEATLDPTPEQAEDLERRLRSLDSLFLSDS